MNIRSISNADEREWLRMRSALWPGPGSEAHPEEIGRYLSGEASEPQEVLVAEASPGHLVGFAELSIRPCAEGCLTSRVGYLEGWYVDPEWRRRGVGRELVLAALSWARAQRCTEFASDTALDNEDSQRAHRALGFEEVGRAVCYRMSLGAPAADADATASPTAPGPTGQPEPPSPPPPGVAEKPRRAP